MPLPPVDERLVMPETRYEIHDGRVMYVSPADEPHGSRHSKLSALLEAYVRDEYDVATDMLTRTSATSDVAPDASVFPRARDPETGRRQLEELAFEVLSTERLAEAQGKAAKLAERGVRRVFALDLGSQRVLEWSKSLETWQMLSPAGVIDDAVFAIPLPVEALVRAGKADDAVAQALIAKGNPAIEREVARGKAEFVLELLAARGLEVPDEVRTRVLGCSDPTRLVAWLRLAVSAESAWKLLE